jgi:hypothetical protein
VFKNAVSCICRAIPHDSDNLLNVILLHSLRLLFGLSTQASLLLTAVLPEKEERWNRANVVIKGFIPLTAITVTGKL